METGFRYRTFDHTADLGIEVEADSPESLFAGAALALSAEIVGADLPPADGTRSVAVDGYDAESLLVRWLSEWVYLVENEGIVPVGFDSVELAPEAVRAAALTADLGAAGIAPRIEIKAVTYHQLAVRLDPGECAVRVVLDL